MKLLTYRYGGVERVGALRGDEVIDLSAVAASMLDLIMVGQSYWLRHSRSSLRRKEGCAGCG